MPGRPYPPNTFQEIRQRFSWPSAPHPKTFSKRSHRFLW